MEEHDLRLVTLDVYPEMTIDTLRSSVEAEGIPAPAQHLYHNGQLITDNTKTLQELQITDGDMLALHIRDMRGSGVAPVPRDQAVTRRRPAGGAAGTAGSVGTAAAGGGGGGEGGASVPQDPELIRLQVLGDPALRGQLERHNPALAATLEDPQRFAQIFQQSSNQQEDARRARMREIAALNADEFNPDAQARIAEIIRNETVMENLQNAMEHNPECVLPELKTFQSPRSVF
jgi:DNA damage-inducible protein 1